MVVQAEQAERNQAVMQSHVLAVDKRYNELFSVFKEVISQRYDAENAVEALQTENNLLKQELVSMTVVISMALVFVFRADAVRHPIVRLVQIIERIVCIAPSMHQAVQAL